MFSDPFTAVMALILLGFAGTLAAFLWIGREMDLLRKSLRDVQSAIQLYAVDSAQRNQDLASLIHELRGGSLQNENTDAAGSSLGDLLERGLPNLVGLHAPSCTANTALRADEDDLLQRLESGPGTERQRK
ncbi:hypothetical protein FACS1894206_03310 [Deltaproteobacteria bacterium]|nr:hypothetical protein FACS1894206_03310 [Deltaproteobacteria bacterium]